MTEQQRYEILYEEMRGMLKTLIEGQDILKETLMRALTSTKEELLERFEVTDIKIEALRKRVEEVEKRLDKVERELEVVKRELEVVKREIVEIKEILKTVATKDDLRILEYRIEKVEARVF